MLGGKKSEASAKSRTENHKGRSGLSWVHGNAKMRLEDVNRLYLA
jgi:hypothetical protein